MNNNRRIAAEILQLADGSHHDPVEGVHHRRGLLDGFRIGQARRLPTCFFLALVKRLRHPRLLRAQRDISINDSQVLAKQSEESLLYRDMQTDLVQQLLRRIAAVRPRADQG